MSPVVNWKIENCELFHELCVIEKNCNNVFYAGNNLKTTNNASTILSEFPCSLTKNSHGFMNKTKKPQVQVLVAMDDIHKLTMLGYFKNSLQRIKIVLRQYFLWL